MNNWDRTRQDNKFRQKLSNVKSTLPKINQGGSSYNQGIKKRSNLPQNSKLPPTNYRKQNNLKRLLYEFGLSQYLRKMFEIGYDDSNIFKLGILTQKEFDELLFNLKVFPGHQVKMVNLYEYLKQMNLSSKNRKPNTSTGTKRYGNTFSGSNRKITSGQLRNIKAVSANTQRNFHNKNNNQMLTSFMNGDFGYNYYLNDQESAKIDKEDSDENNKTIRDDQMDNMKEEIDQMLKYYMIQLNEKLDDSYDSIEDSSLSHVNITNENIKEIKEKEMKKELEDISAIKANNNNSLYSQSLLRDKSSSKEVEINGKGNDIKLPKGINVNNNKENKVNPPISKKSIPIKLPSINNSSSNTNNVTSNSKKEESEKEKIQINAKNTQELTKEKQKQNIKKDKNIEENYEIKEEEIIEETQANKVTNTKKEEKKEEIKKEEGIKKEEEERKDEKEEEKDDDYYFDQEEQIPEEDNISKKQILENIQQNQEHEPKTPKVSHSTSPPKQEKRPLSASNHKQPTQSEKEAERYRSNQLSKEQEIYENIRLTKSSEGDYLRQNLDQFDIEYMCRCLGLAIMKHIETGKDKQHITDLMDIKDNFSFFNSLYNSKMDFLFNFFSKDNNTQQMSNLDRLDLEEHEKQKKETISFVSHFKQKKDEELLKQTEEKEKIKFHSNYGDIEKDIKFIDEFFSISNRKVKNYQNLSEKTKNILNKELSYINEVDSEIMNSKLNSSSNNKDNNGDNANQSTDKKGYDNILRQSMQNILNKEEEADEDEMVNTEQKEENKDQQPPTENQEINNKFSSVPNQQTEETYKQTPIMKINEEIPTDKDNAQKEIFESGEMESNYVIDASTIDKLKNYIIKQAEIYDDDYFYPALRVQTRKYVPPPDPQQIFEFCANIMCLTKMEKEVIIITLIYLERLIFNTGLLLTSRNWRRITFTAMIIASKIWDDDSFENNHFAQVFTHLKIGEINLLERTYLELINYKVYVKCSEYFKYFFIIKSIALKYNFNGMNLVPISVERMMKIQEYAYQMQKKMRKRYSLNNSAQF